MKYRIISVIFMILLVSSCSINRAAVRMISKSLTDGSGNVFTSDEDPELIGDSLPFVLKMYEIMLEADPENQDLLSAAAQGFVVYSNIYVHMPADMLDYNDWEKQSRMYIRAKKLYLRGCRYAESSLNLRNKGFSEAVENNDLTEILKKTGKDDVADLYWFGIGLMGAYSIDITDPYLAPKRKTAFSALERGYEIDSDYGNGAFHDFFIQYYASLPENMGGGIDKAEYHFKKSLEISEYKKASPYISYALSVCTKKQNDKGVAEFKNVLEKAKLIDENEVPENRLENIVFKEKADWLLKNIDNYFLID